MLPGVYAAPRSRTPGKQKYERLGFATAMQYCLVCCRTSLVLARRAPRSHRSSRAQRPEATARFLIQSPIHPRGAVEREGLRYSDPALTAIDLATFACSDGIDIGCDPSSNPGKHVRGVAHDSSSRGQSGKAKALDRLTV